MNLEELDRVLDGARQAPLSEPDYDKLKDALHAMAALLARSRNTEKTNAVVGDAAGAEASEGGAVGCHRASAGRTRAEPRHGVHWRAHGRDPASEPEARRTLPGMRTRKCVRAEGAEGAGADCGAGAVGGDGVFAGAVALRSLRAGVHGARSRKEWGRRSTTRRRRR